jgi:hypothetical protein
MTMQEYRESRASAIDRVVTSKAIGSVAASKASSLAKTESVGSQGVRASRAEEVLRRKARFVSTATTALARAYSGQQDLSQEEWLSMVKIWYITKSYQKKSVVAYKNKSSNL